MNSPHDPNQFGYQQAPGTPQPQPLGAGGDDPFAPGAPKLGSLAQQARGKKLDSARAILYVVGALFVILNLALLLNARNEMKQVIQKEVQKLGPGMIVDQAKAAEVENTGVRILRIIYGSFVALGVVFIIFGAMVKSYPVPITITALVLFLGYQALIVFFDPSNLAKGIILKVIVIVGLVKAIQAAIAYQKEEEMLIRRAESQGL
ncbi:MAG: hypothetical protein AB7K24_14465 [Gemmataceae bacterium]